MAVSVWSCTDSKTTDGVKVESNVIDVPAAIAQTQQLTVSDLGNISYVPLETTDSSLLHNDFNFKATPTHLLVSTGNRCLMFDKKTRKYLGDVSRRGQGPEEYNTPNPGLQSDGSKMYFYRRFPDAHGAVVYNEDREYIGSVHPGSVMGSGNYFVVDTVMFAPIFHSNLKCDFFLGVSRSGLHQSKPDSIIRMPFGEKTYDSWDACAIKDVAGVMPKSDILIHHMTGFGGTDYNDYVAVTRSPRMFYQYGDKFGFKYPMVDTVDRVTPDGMDVHYVFNTGEGGVNLFNIPANGGVHSDNLIMADVYETPDQLIFCSSVGFLKEDGSKPYISLLDKKSGTEGENGFVDDQTGFMPFFPIATDAQGNYLTYLTMDEIAKYVEEHPDVKLPEAIANLPEDANPVIVIVGK